MKEELRQKYKIKRRFLGAVLRQEAELHIAEYFLSAYGRFGSYFIYNSVGSEAGTGRIVSALLAAGKQVYLPRVEGKEIVPVPYGPLKKGAYGIPEPQGAAFSGTPEVTAVPLLAVDPRGYRLGYGGGYYDRYLKNKNTVKVGLGFALQLSDELCEDEWDEPLDAFICERGIYDFAKRK